MLALTFSLLFASLALQSTAVAVEDVTCRGFVGGSLLVADCWARDGEKRLGNGRCRGSLSTDRRCSMSLEDECLSSDLSAVVICLAFRTYLLGLVERIDTLPNPLQHFRDILINTPHTLQYLPRLLGVPFAYALGAQEKCKSTHDSHPSTHFSQTIRARSPRSPRVQPWPLPQPRLNSASFRERRHFANLAFYFHLSSQSLPSSINFAK